MRLVCSLHELKKRLSPKRKGFSGYLKPVLGDVALGTKGARNSVSCVSSSPAQVNLSCSCTDRSSGSSERSCERSCASMPPSQETRQELVESLTAMGFPEDRVLFALEATGTAFVSLACCDTSIETMATCRSNQS